MRSASFRLEITPVERRQLPAPPPLPFASPPACLSAPAARSPLSASTPRKARNGNVSGSVPLTETGPVDEKRARSSRRDSARTRRITYKTGHSGKMSPVTSLGSVLDSHNPQRLEISERASAARGAMQRVRAHRATLLDPSPLPPRWSLTLYAFVRASSTDSVQADFTEATGVTTNSRHVV